MAEPVGLASAILALATFAFYSSIVLYNDIKNFHSHPKQVRDLLEELYALNVVLGMLIETIDLATNVDLSALEIHLQRCGNSCKFGEDLMRFFARSNADRTSFRDWARLKYMGEGIDGFRQQLSSYKSTINIALTDATL
ncbi:hypothetical protein EDB80DRAFT_593027 [Ilyonectria destructans]|nr:hypothetical protein EDB80DRAFT_593027 [Ilyonectria destructans]